MRNTGKQLLSVTRKGLIRGIACLCACSFLSVGQSLAQDTRIRNGFYSKKVNFGVNAGFNSSMFLISDFTIHDVSIEGYQNNYKVGYFGTAFLRVNLKRHYIQPELSYNVSKSEISFDKLGSQHPDIEPDYALIKAVTHSIDFPILYGYSLVKRPPYNLSFFVGPKLRYIVQSKSNIRLKNFDQTEINEDLYPVVVNAVAGISVSISNVFFDFRYEQGLHNISKSINYNYTGTGRDGKSQLTLNRREQVISFSLGIIF